MNSIAPQSLDKLDRLANQAIKTLDEVARHEMTRAGFPPEQDARGLRDTFKTLILLYESAIINKTIDHSNAILLNDSKTEGKDVRTKK